MASVTGRAVQVTAEGGDFELLEKEYPDPGPGHVRIRVQACGVCHSDSITKFGIFPIEYPRYRGTKWPGGGCGGRRRTVIQAGATRGAGVAWRALQLLHSCRRGDFILCENGLISGISFDGGYADYVIAPANALAFIPEELNDVDAAPLLCAGITTYNSLRNSGARPGDLVAIVGVGGLGHLGVQYAAKSGYRTVAIARGQDKAPLAKQLGAHVYIDTMTQDPAVELQKLGGATVILSTVTSADALEAVMGGLGPDGKLIINGVPERAMGVSAMQMIGKRQSVVGWPSGSGMDSEDTLNFSALSGVKPMVETYPLEQAAEAFDRMMSGKARFRVVLTMGA